MWPPTLDRQYAYFRVTGLFDPADVTKAIGIEPTEAWAVDDKYSRNGRSFSRHSSKWTLGSGLDDTRLLDDHLEALLFRLERRYSGVLQASTLGHLQFVCVSYSYQSFSWELDFRHQQRATALHIGFWIDSYGHGDVHEEVVELREQLGLRGSDMEER
ncbi:DUF4279 domain-containing protein [Chachezhania sediminis]|uniref:DUF4279 domain-containing protein n=1 Tax=Chachezhania sediminis TaxID=2599291 RepID=UPI00131D1CE7|nr:DUF4279 domain-containing protein [Chachezhania sediminis]